MTWKFKVQSELQKWKSQGENKVGELKNRFRNTWEYYEFHRMKKKQKEEKQIKKILEGKFPPDGERPESANWKSSPRTELTRKNTQ